MKINTNIPIFIILTLFVASNALLYRYLNNDYFIDKKPETKSEKIDNVIFSLIAAHETVLSERNAAILAEADRLRNLKANITDSAELKAIEEQLKALEAESQAVLERVKNSENERKIAQQQAENNQMQLTELLAANSKMGAALESINEEFDTYVTTVKDTFLENSYTDVEINRINTAFRINRGLDYLTDVVANVQKHKSELIKNYTNEIKTLSDEYRDGLQIIAGSVGDNEYEAILDEEELIKTTESIEILEDSIGLYKDNRDIDLKKIERDLTGQIEELKKQLADADRFSLAEKATLEEALAAKDLEYESLVAEMEAAKLLAQEDKAQSLEELETRLREELVARESIVKVDLPAPDSPIFTRWVHIPGLWSSTNQEITYSGKKVDTIAWSKTAIDDNISISFNGEFDDKGECLMILYGSGRFKNWNSGIVLSLTTLGRGRAMLTLTKNGVGENSETIYTHAASMDGTISGSYFIQIIEGKLTIYLNGSTLLSNFPMDMELSGKIGFGNREENSYPYSITNIKLFNVE